MGFFIGNWKWLLSGVALFVFVAVQHILYVSLLKACRAFKAELDSGTAGPAAGSGGFVWLRDVRTMFSQQDGGWIDNSPLPREAVIDSLDNEIWRTSRYSALQRWGLAAPLIGVILSALGFMISPPELTGAVSDIMSKLGPLFVGVFVGALMALINQVYLHFASLELGRVRAKAVRWFDEVIWKTIRQNAHNVLGQAAAETQAAAKSLELSSHQLATCNLSYRDSLLELNQQLGFVRSAAQSTSSSFDAFNAMIGDMSSQLGASIRNLSNLNASAAVVDNASVVWNVAAARVHNASSAIEDSSRRFNETCGNFSTNFDHAGRAMQEGVAESTGGLLAAVNKLTAPLGQLEGSIRQMQTNTDRHSELSTALTNAVEQSDRFLVERMAVNIDEAKLQQEMASRARVAIDSLRKLAETVDTVNNTGGSLNLAAAGLRESSATIGSALKSLLDSCSGFSEHCKELQANMNSEVSETTAHFQNAARELAQPIKLLNTSISRVSASAENHAVLAERIDGAAKQTDRLLQDRAQASADESARVKRMDEIEKRLKETAQIVSDSAVSMRQVQNGLDTLVKELRTAPETAGPRRGRWLSWLSTPRLKDTSTLQNGDSDDRA